MEVRSDLPTLVEACLPGYRDQILGVYLDETRTNRETGSGRFDRMMDGLRFLAGCLAYQEQTRRLDRLTRRYLDEIQIGNGYPNPSTVDEIQATTCYYYR